MARRLLLSSDMPQSAMLATHSDQALERVVGEYLQLPGLSLSVPQARRLLGVDTPKCEQLLEELVEQHFLRRTPRGLYVRSIQA